MIFFFNISLKMGYRSLPSPFPKEEKEQTLAEFIVLKASSSLMRWFLILGLSLGKNNRWFAYVTTLVS